MQVFTGWEPDAPPEDTLLRSFVLNNAEALAHEVEALGGDVLRTDQVVATRMGRPSGFLEGAVLLQPPDTHLSDLMRQVGDFLAGAGGSAWLFSAWPVDLRPYGCEIEGHPPLMFRLPGEPPPPNPPGLRVVRVKDRATVAAYNRVVVDGFPLPGVVEPVLDERVLAVRGAAAWLGYSGDEPVAASTAYTAYGITNVTLVATMPQHRRRGYGEALTWWATLVRPDLPAMLLASDDGRPVYERMGYLPLLRFALWRRDKR